MEERRATDTTWGDTASILAILYTLVFAAMVYGLFMIAIPEGNEATINQLVGIMSAIQLAIIGFYFGGSKLSEQSQKLFAASKERADSAIQEIAKAAPVVAASSPQKAGDVQMEVAGNVTVDHEKK